MRQIVLSAALLFSLGSQSGADTASFSKSQAQVTPDIHYARSNFSGLWPHINLEEAKRLLGQPGVIFADGRNFNEWEQSHIPGAIALPGGEFDKRYAQQKSRLRKAKIIVTYCHGENCGLADYLAQLLSDKGHKNIAVFYTGFPAWKSAKLPTEGKDVSQTKKAAP